MLKRIITSLLMVLAFAISAQAADLKMDCNAIYGATNFHSQGAKLFADKVAEYTSGSVQITVHPGGSLGFKGPELLKTVKDGTLPMSDILMGVVSGSDQVFGVSSMPLLAKDYAEAKKLYEAAKPYYDKACRRWNQKMLYAAPWPPSGLFTKEPLNTAADFEGLKTRTYDKNGAELLRAAGASPMSLPWGELYSALQTGLVDSVLTSAVSGKDGKFWENLKYFTKINYAFPLNMMVINQDYWDALNPKQQEAVLKAAAEVEAYQWEQSAKSNDDSLKILAEKGIVITEPSKEISDMLNRDAKLMLENTLKGAKKGFKAAIKAYEK
ncbi:TRAP transporter substrate-binding protein [Maridesulfovibrio salexigens]|uniref:TRAP dicarboxylate transporter-DctP subunit n=1 Tax=Maridesulfovibrio salexigens (strain ATCC 14822 / DSM 2638 / NCIMB 8403 / VKM B-1763) TaxID=526222 RepID=C6C271_MARSD|nr:TRAP transporter substrate-binding protein [Maridesulfovibrio salexigens]ACS81272.1 TRAP dicarboxylate transporter- DctP subunit [Maridesulfovibrio salexigens DSM 2638]